MKRRENDRPINNNYNDIFSNFFTNNVFNDAFGTSNQIPSDIFSNFFGNNNQFFQNHEPKSDSKIILPEGEDIIATEDAKDEDICKICYTNVVNTINLPCCHIVFCIKCANIYGHTKKICPICKEDMNAIKKTFK